MRPLGGGYCVTQREKRRTAMRIAELAMAIILSMVSIYLMWKAGQPISWDPTSQRFDNIGFIEGQGPGSGFWPFWLSAAMLVMCGWIIVNWVLKLSPPSRSEEPFLDAYGVRMLVMVGGGLIAFLGLIHVVGFYGAIPLFLFYYIYFLGRHGLLQSVLISLLAPVFCFFFFEIGMTIPLEKGYTGPLFDPIYALIYD